MRWPFTDGWNSFWHVLFGAVATQFAVVGILFTLYQFWDIFEKNMLVDMGEFFCGYFACAIPQMRAGMLHW